MYEYSIRFIVVGLTKWTKRFVRTIFYFRMKIKKIVRLPIHSYGTGYVPIFSVQSVHLDLTSVSLPITSFWKIFRWTNSQHLDKKLKLYVVIRSLKSMIMWLLYIKESITIAGFAWQFIISSLNKIWIVNMKWSTLFYSNFTIFWQHLNQNRELDSDNFLFYGTQNFIIIIYTEYSYIWIAQRSECKIVF